jgi:hypothetical protein
MEWYHYLMCFFGGAFVANFFPHFVRGITGTKFPTPFAKPPGRGLSPAPINVLWALVNLVVGFLLLRAGGFSFVDVPALLTGFAGFAAMSLMMSNVFSQRMQE